MKNRIIKTGFIFSMLFFFNSCSDYLDINYDPSFPQTATSASILPPLFAQIVRGESFDARYVGQYVQNWASTAVNNAWDAHGYVPNSDAAGEMWRQHYWAIGKNIDLIIEQATAAEQWDYVGVAKAIRAWSWQTSTDVYGEMILKQAWEPNRYIFDFDSQEDVYAEVRRLCEEALVDLARTDGKVSVVSLAQGDLVYKGDRAKWTKFVNAVLARNAHHISNKASYNPDKVIEYVDKSFGSTAEGFHVPHTGSSSADANFFGPLRNNLRSYRATQYFVNLLNGTTLNGVVDPRLPLMYSPAADGEYRGATPLLGDPTNVNNNAMRLPLLWGVSPSVTNAASIPGKYIFTDKADHFLLTFFELQFMKAEAALKKGDKNMAYDAFIKGVKAHMDFTKVVAADQTTYLTSAAMPQSANDLTMSDVMQQKYIALWVHGALETWVDMRRHKYSQDIYKNFALPTTFYIDNPGKSAQRLRPRFNSEFVWNRDALVLFGGDKADFHTTELWFVKN